MNSKDLDTLTQAIVRFRDERDWKQFHKPKDMAISLSLEAAELLEHFQWRSDSETEEYLGAAENLKELGAELVDVLYWVLLMAHDLKIDLAKAFQDKMTQNIDKYPIASAKGSSRKYNG